MQQVRNSAQTDMSPARAARPRAGLAALGLVLALAGCNRGPAPLSQPMDAGMAPGANGAQMAQNGERQRGLHVPAGPQTPAAPAPAPAPPPNANNSAARITDNPGEPMSADPMQDAGGFDPSPQNDLDSGSGGGQETNRNDGPHT